MPRDGSRLARQWQCKFLHIYTQDTEGHASRTHHTSVLRLPLAWLVSLEASESKPSGISMVSGQLAFLYTCNCHEVGNHRRQRLRVYVHIPDSGGLEIRQQGFGSRMQHQWREALDRRAWREHQTRTAKPETAAHDTRKTQLVFSTAIVSSAAPAENPMVARWPPVMACIGHRRCHRYTHLRRNGGQM